jgi:thiol-disulfide isomerase/thioredoxin
MNVRSLTSLAIALACVGCGSNSAPSYELYSLDGKKAFTADDYKGQVVVMDFWATWCGPCKKIQPVVHQWADKYSKSGVNFIGVTSEAPSVVSAFVERTPLGYSAMIDRGDLAQAQFKIGGYPTLVIIDRNGEVAYNGTPFETAKVESILTRLTTES